MDLTDFLKQHGLTRLKHVLSRMSVEDVRSLFPEGDKLDKLKLPGFKERQLKRAVETLPFESKLPTPLALSLKEFHISSTGAESLWMACNFLEIVLKFCFATVIAERTESCGAAAMPQSLTLLISKHLKTPGLGEWLDMTEAAMANDGAWHSSTALQGALLNTVEKVVAFKEVHRMLDIRNRLAHGGWFRKSPAEVDRWKTPFLDFVAKDLSWMEQAELVAQAGDKLCLFRGEKASECNLHIPALNRMEDGTCFLHLPNFGGTVLDVSPFAATSSAAPLPLMYSRWKTCSIEYISYGGSVDWLREPRQKRNRIFKEKFFRQSLTWLPSPFAASQTAVESDSLKQVLRTVKERLGKCEGGVLLIQGTEGSGKSTLAKELAGRYFGQRTPNLTLLYRFEKTSFLSHRRYFLFYIYHRLKSATWCTFKGREEAWKFSDTPVHSSPSEFHVSVEMITNLISEKLSAGGMLLLVIDGIEAIVGEDAHFLAEVLFPILEAHPKVLAVVTALHNSAGDTHPNDLLHLSRKGRAELVFKPDVPRMSLGEFTSVLRNACGDSSVKLLDLQRQCERESAAFDLAAQRYSGGEHSPFHENDRPSSHSFGFLEEAHRKGNGSPLYASYLAEDLRSGVIRIGDTNALPEGIGGYHNLQLSRTGVLEMLSPLPRSVIRTVVSGFCAAVEMRLSQSPAGHSQKTESVGALHRPIDEYLARASLLALMATESNGVTLEEISERLGQTVFRGQNAEDRSAVVERALEAVSSMLKAAPIDESGREGFELGNQSMRRHLNSLPGVQQMTHRFARQTDHRPPPESREPNEIPPLERPRGNQSDEIPFEEQHFKERLSTLRREISRAHLRVEENQRELSRLERQLASLPEEINPEQQLVKEKQVEEAIFSLRQEIAALSTWLEKTMSEFSDLQNDHERKMAARLQRCMIGFESITKCLQASELYLAEAQNAVAGSSSEWFRPHASEMPRTTDDAVAILTKEEYTSLYLRPSVAFEALARMNVLKNLCLFNRTLTSHIFQENSLDNWVRRAERAMYAYPRNRYEHLVYTTPVSRLDRLIYGAVRDTSSCSTEVGKITGFASLRELEAVESTVAEILDVVRAGTDLSILDNCPMAVRIQSYKDRKDSSAKLLSIKLVFRDLPVEVELCHDDIPLS